MKTLVIGGTGTVGSRVVAGLLEKGLAVRCLTHSPEKAKALPQGVEALIGDLERPETLSKAFEGIERVFLLVAVSQTETEQGLAAVEAAKKAGAKRIVYLSVALPPGSEHIPHFASKVPIEEAVRRSRMEDTTLRPNNYFQNDYWYQQPLLEHGVYPQPLGPKGLNRVDVRDIAEAAVIALTRGGHAGQVYPLHGADSLTGETTARAWGRALGREVRYGGDDLEAWSKEALTGLPEWMVHDFRIMYEYFQKLGFGPGPGDLDRQQQLLGHPPRTFDAFAAETAASWKRG